MPEIPIVLLDRTEKLLTGLGQSPVSPERAEPLLRQVRSALEAGELDALKSSLKALHSLQEQARDRATMPAMADLQGAGGRKTADSLHDPVGMNKLIPLVSELQLRVRELRDAAGAEPQGVGRNERG